MEKRATKKEHRIDSVLPGSIAEELEIEPGDVLVSINGQELADVFDYHFHLNDEYLTVLIRKPNGEEWELEIEKEYEEDLGIEFENGLMDEYKSCSNHCIFCFIDQMPPGMRETLYFKDDDSRLSFLQGNYVTLTNMTEKDIRRIIDYKLAPINISVQTMNPKLRCEMLHNRFAGEALKKMRRLYEADIEMNGQIVLCKGVNDGEELERSIRELTAYLPHMASVSVVPVGLSRYREHLYPLEPFTKEDARGVLATIHRWQDYCMERWGSHFVHAGDEWYLLAEQELPEADNYDGYIQLENGVGMMRLLLDEFGEALMLEGTPESGTALELEETFESGTALELEKMPESGTVLEHEKPSESGTALELEKTESGTVLEHEKPLECGTAGVRGTGRDVTRDKASRQTISVATGKLAAPFIKQLAQRFMERHPEKDIHVYAIRNDFFGERITVSGLLTGQDLLAQLKGRQLGARLLLPCNLLRSGEEVFLDDMTVTELKNALQVEIVIVNSNGQDLYHAFLG